ncbi:MAG: DsbA family protein [Brevundimonas sp.]|uniref:DsbA family protein n=1 Tax=Brevundimonas sp. TaxID=1871086 RepID=UPI00391D3171
MNRLVPWLVAMALTVAVSSGAAAQTAGDAHHGHDHAPVMATAPVPEVTADDRILGDADAPVTVIEYASFTCGHCASWHEQVFPALKERFIDTGQVRFVHRDLPTAPQDLARQAATIARCATPDRFYEAVDALMGGQAEARESGDVTGWLVGGAAAGAVTPERLEACMADDALTARLDASIQGARDAGVTGTPTFFVNGEPVDGDLDSLEAAITPLIAQGG